MTKKLLFFAGFFGLISPLFSQNYTQWSSGQIYHHLLKLKVMGSVLYVAAHPDDENTRLITWLANDQKLNTAYLSLTRGEGGQNLIGSELGDELGAIRTHELTQARMIDGGMQFFSRAADFGFSKDPTETFKIWNRKKILGDLVYVVRRFQPDVIITRFNTEPGKTHGHHTASAMLANECMEIALDTNEYYDQLTYANVWKPSRIFWNTSSFFYDKDFKKDTLLQVDVGGYNSLLGNSYTEIAALSRSCHKSQGFGTIGSRGEQMEYFIHTGGSYPTNRKIFDGLDFTWNRIKGGKSILTKVDHIIEKFSFNDPSLSVESLIDLYTSVEALHQDSYLVKKKLQEISELIAQCMGFYHEVYTDDYIYAVGDTLRLKTETINRSGKYLTYLNMRLPYGKEWLVEDFAYNRQCIGNESQKWTSQSFTVKEDAAFSNPTWWNVKSIETDAVGYMRNAENKPFENLTYSIIPSFNNEQPIHGLVFNGTIMYRKQHPSKGEVHQPVYLAPPVTVTPLQKSMVFTSSTPRSISLQLQAFKPMADGYVSLKLPPGWKASPEKIDFNFVQKRETKNISFTITPPDTNATGEIQAEIICNGRAYSCAFEEISYDHIPTIVMFPPATCRLIKIGHTSSFSRVAYIEGAGDDVAGCLSEMGFKVDIIKPENYFTTDYSVYTAVVLGIRSYNTIDNIHSLQTSLFGYVENGGNLIVQYVTTAGLKPKENGPFPFKISRNRVTDEKAPVSMLDPSHPVFNRPFKIDSTDFNGWIQERGLYFASDFDKNYTALLSMADPGEEQDKGSLIIARHGKGYFMYTGLSFFRELPEGVPGAYKLLANMIEMK